jgi:hypothetical protein
VASFDKEKGRVILLMRRLGLAPDEYRDPSAGGAGESGADVVVVFGNRRIGIQVTDLDMGDVPGTARREETGLARGAAARGGAYLTWGQNDLGKITDAIVRSLTRKARMSFAGFDEFWLLMCAGVPELGAIGATAVMTPWLAVAPLGAATLPTLEGSKYTRAFIHAALGVEEQALYEWEHGASWSKSTIKLPPAQQGPGFWDYKDDPELLRDPEGWCEREAKRVLAELRGTSAGVGE